MLKNLEARTAETQHEILTIKMAARELYERMMVTYWSDNPGSREYHLKWASKELEKLAEIAAKYSQGAGE